MALITRARLLAQPPSSFLHPNPIPILIRIRIRKLSDPRKPKARWQNFRAKMKISLITIGSCRLALFSPHLCPSPLKASHSRFSISATLLPTKNIKQKIKLRSSIASSEICLIILPGGLSRRWCSSLLPKLFCD